jgi:hypothetical protein
MARVDVSAQGRNTLEGSEAKSVGEKGFNILNWRR